MKVANVWSSLEMPRRELRLFLLMQVKDEINAGNLLYQLGKVEFKNVYFSYTDGLVHTGFYSLHAQSRR